MENETELEKKDGVSSVCTIVKPEPRTPITTVTSVTPLTSVSTITSLTPVSPTEPLDVLPLNVATSTPSNNQQSDSPSKKKGELGLFLSQDFFAVTDHESSLSDTVLLDAGVPKRSQHQGPEDIYLDDLNVLEPDVAARYFPKRLAHQRST